MFYRLKEREDNSEDISIGQFGTCGVGGNR